MKEQKVKCRGNGNNSEATKIENEKKRNGKLPLNTKLK